MQYTVSEIAELAGVSVRTLHYYDEIGLLKPTGVKSNGYRVYEEPEIERLQQILFFRELDFPLEKIRKIMSSADYDTPRVLEEQKALLVLKRNRLDNLIITINKTLKSMKEGKHMSNDDKFSAFNDPTYLHHKDEAEKRWGKTDAYKQSMERVEKMSSDDLKRLKYEGDEINQAVAELMQSGSAIDSEEVQFQIKRHFIMISNFYEPNAEMYKGLGQMYVQDPRFGIHYESVAPGLAAFMSQAMDYYAQKLES